jgi:RNA polymerase subunit RPABC4/transcription elongation factor Spt4
MNLEEDLYSNCCYVLLKPDSDICPRCGEHCEGIDEVEAEFERTHGMDRF